MKLLHDDRFRERGLHNFDDNLLQPRHRWYPFKEGFSCELVDYALATMTGGDSNRRLRVIDPFSGSGTTPITAALKGHEAYAIEVNPFCAFTARVKASPGIWREKPYVQRLDQLIAAARKDLRPTVLERQSTFSEGGGKAKWLFNTQVLRAFYAGTRAIQSSGGSHSAPFRLAAIRAAMTCCNAKKDGKALRYLKKWKDLAFSAPDFFDHFRAAAIQFRDDTELATIDTKTPVKILTGDSRRALASTRAQSFDLLVTSPPYLNSFDYSDVYRPELFLGGFVSNNDELKRIRLRTLRSHIQVKWDGETKVESQLLTKPLKELQRAKELWNGRLPEMVQAYFHDMHKVLAQAVRVLAKNGQAWIVVSTSSYAGVHIPVDLILAELGTTLGLQLNGVYFLRALRAAGQQQSSFGTTGLPLRESLLVMTQTNGNDA